MICLECGYDLSGSPLGPCPECGSNMGASQAEVSRRRHAYLKRASIELRWSVVLHIVCATALASFLAVRSDSIVVGLKALGALLGTLFVSVAGILAISLLIERTRRSLAIWVWLRRLYLLHPPWLLMGLAASAFLLALSVSPVDHLSHAGDRGALGAGLSVVVGIVFMSLFLARILDDLAELRLRIGRVVYALDVLVCVITFINCGIGIATWSIVFAPS